MTQSIISHHRVYHITSLYGLLEYGQVLRLFMDDKAENENKIAKIQ